MIKSYPWEQLSKYGPQKNLVILVEESEDIFNQVKVSEEDFKRICSILNKGSEMRGFVFNVYKDKFKIEEVDGEEGI